MASAADVPRARATFGLSTRPMCYGIFPYIIGGSAALSARRASVVTRAPPPYLHTAME